MWEVNGKVNKAHIKLVTKLLHAEYVTICTSGGFKTPGKSMVVQKLKGSEHL